MYILELLLTFVEHFLCFFIILEELDSYVALNYISMNFSLGKPTTIRMTNFLIIKIFNLQYNDCKYKTE